VILSLVGGMILIALSVVALTIILRGLSNAQRNLAVHLGKSLPLRLGPCVIIAGWASALIVGLALVALFHP